MELKIDDIVKVTPSVLKLNETKGTKYPTIAGIVTKVLPGCIVVDFNGKESAWNPNDLEKEFSL